MKLLKVADVVGEPARVIAIARAKPPLPGGAT
jgi:hypothetical protein